MLRALLVVGAMGCLAVGATLGSVSVIALRRSEGVFLPAGYVALVSLAVGAYLGRLALRG